MKVLFQVVDRYQESVPSFEQYDVEGDCLTEEMVLKLMSEYYDDEITNFDGYFDYHKPKLQKSQHCWCVWGEETDIIVTVL